MEIAPAGGAAQAGGARGAGRPAEVRRRGDSPFIPASRDRLHFARVQRLRAPSAGAMLGLRAVNPDDYNNDIISYVNVSGRTPTVHVARATEAHELMMSLRCSFCTASRPARSLSRIDGAFNAIPGPLGWHRMVPHRRAEPPSRACRATPGGRPHREKTRCCAEPKYVGRTLVHICFLEQLQLRFCTVGRHCLKFERKIGEFERNG